jgi:prephenate dehydrogenase
VHTLFGPESGQAGLKGLAAVLCRGSAGRTDCLHIRRFLKKKIRLKVVEMTAQEHDRQMAWQQGLSHFMSMAFQKMKAPALRFRTPSFEKFRAMNHLLRRTTWPLFETIEKENPYATGVRRKFLAELGRLDRRLSSAGRKTGKRK